MIKRILLGYLFFFLCICLCKSASAQDSTKKVEPEKQTVINNTPSTAKTDKKAVTKTPIQPQMKHGYRYRRMYHAPVVAVPNQDSIAAANNSNIQTPPPVQNTDKSLNGQYQYLLTKIYHYQQPLVAALWKNVSDTLSHERNKLKELQAKINAKNHTVDSLKSDANTKTQTLSESGNKADSISLLGLSVSKGTYNLIMFGLIIGLGIALIIVISSIAKYKRDAKHHIELYEDLEDDFKTYKSKATEKELKLARELQTERNKLDELMGKG